MLRSTFGFPHNTDVNICASFLKLIKTHFPYNLRLQTLKRKKMGKAFSHHCAPWALCGHVQQPFLGGWKQLAAAYLCKSSSESFRHPHFYHYTGGEVRRAQILLLQLAQHLSSRHGICTQVRELRRLGCLTRPRKYWADSSQGLMDGKRHLLTHDGVGLPLPLPTEALCS